MLRPLRYLSSGLVRLLVLVVLTLGVVLVALTQTQVGRDATATQLEAQFADRFQGELDIGRLTGNLLRQMRASDVRILDDSGLVVVRIDSMVISPRWTDLLRQRLDINRIELIRPQIRLDPAGVNRTGLQRIFERPDSAGGPWQLRTIRLTVEDGTVLPGSASWTRFGVSGLHVDARVDATVSPLLIDLLSLSARFPEAGSGIQDASGQLTIDGSRMELTNARVATDASRLDLDASFDPDGEIVLDMRTSSVSFDEMARFAPEFPLRGAGSMSLSARGPLEGLVVSESRFDFGSSTVELNGYMVGLPDSAAFEASVSSSRLMARDLRRLLPSNSAVQETRFDSLGGALTLSGSWRDGRWRLAGPVELGGSAGSITGDINLAGRAASIRSATLDLALRQVDPAALYRVPIPASSLTGSIFLQAAVDQRRSMTGRLVGDLQNSRIGSRRIDRASARAEIVPKQLSAWLQIFEADGELQASLTRDRTGARRFAVETRLQQFDVGPLLGRSNVATRLSGSANVDGRGVNWGYADAGIRLDSGFVEVGGIGSPVPAQEWQLAVRADGTDNPSASLTGNDAAVTLQSDADVSHLLSVARAWQSAISASAARLRNRPYNPDPGRADDLTSSLAEAEAALRRASARSPATRDRVHTRMEVEVRDAAPLSAWWPTGPSWGGAFAFHMDLRADLDSLALNAGLEGDSIRWGRVALLNPASRWTTRAAFGDPLAADLWTDAHISGERLETRVSDLVAPEIRLHLSEGAGQIQMTSAAGPEVGPVRLQSGLSIAGDRLRMQISRADVTARNYAWTVDGRPVVELYSDALVVDGFQLHTAGEEGARQSLRIDGALSNEPSDTLSIAADRLELIEASRFSGISPEIAGRLDARLALTGGSLAPRIAGTAGVAGFTIGSDLIGDIDFRSDLVTGSPDIVLRLEVRPSPAVPVHARRALPNALVLDGTVRLPSADRSDPGAWNLNLRADRLEMFFIEYIFTQAIDRADGFLAGGGTIQGPFDAPIFDLNLDLREGAFGVPVTGAQYQAAGRLRIDREAIHFDEALLNDLGGGSARITGSLNFNEYQFFSLDLAGELEELEIMSVAQSDTLPFYGFLRGSGTAYLTGPIADATLRIPDGRTREDSELFIPMTEELEETDNSFIILADSTGKLPDLDALIRRPNVISRRATAERRFVDGLNMDFNIFAPPGSIVNLVIDPLLGDVIRARSTGRVQLTREQGEFRASGELRVEGGDYLFTAGEVFVRRFLIEEGGTIVWDGDPIDALLNIPAAYRTRASLAGLEGVGEETGALVPLVVELQITGRVLAPEVALRLAIDRTNQNVLGDYQALEARLNQPDRATEYATSVLLTNSFQLTTDNLSTASGEQLAFNSVSQLVSSQLNRFLSAALPNVDFNFGLQGERAQDLDITYGVALRLLDERLVIRGQGVYQGSRTDATTLANEGLQGEFVVEVRLSPTVSVEVFFRREGDILQSTELTNTAGAGLSYQTEFWSWRRFLRQVFGWTFEDRRDDAPADSSAGEPVSW